MSGVRRKSWRGWPRLKRLADGRVRIEGRCLTVGRWIAAQRIGLLISTLCGLLTLAVSTALWWGPATAHLVGNDTFDSVIRALVMMQRDLRETIISSAPEISSKIGYLGYGRVDPHLAVVGILLCLSRRVMGRLYARVLIVVFRRVFARKFSITIGVSSVQIGRGLFAKPFHGNPSRGGIRFRVVDPSAQYAPFSSGSLRGRRMLAPLVQIPPAIVEIVDGYNRHVVIFPRRRDQAEAIVARCLEVSHSFRMIR